MFDTLLIANRGEIACRVIASARALGLRTVAVYSDADRDARHVQLADDALRLGEAPARDSYLHIERVLDACRRAGAGAVHPGYGFLSENAAFARACRDAGIVFVGPAPEAIDALGHKSAAKLLALRIGVPCLPGYAGAAQDIDTLVAEARRIGEPLMIKAAAGGGGRGMRRCTDVGDLAALTHLLEAARTEASASFGSGELLLERLVEDARHVELQVFGDAHGGAVHLGERDCSTQRRHQKILEEAPAPGVSAELRERMGAAAVKLVREVGYVGAGTVEFLLAPDGSFSFLEMNTRLQVEHPVTEAITGLDLVEWQLRIARGEPLPLAQHDIRWQGHAIEARLCAEDAFAGFAPQAGRIVHWQVPEGAGVRVDHGLTLQPTIPPHYDSMIAKVIACGADREQARARLLRALAGSTVLGLRTNRDYLLHALRAPAFVAPGLASQAGSAARADARCERAGDDPAVEAYSTHWLERASAHWPARRADGAWAAIAAVLLLHRQARRFGPFALWSSGGVRETPLKLRIGEATVVVRLAYGAGLPVVATVGGERHELEVLADDGLRARLAIDGSETTARATLAEGGGWLDAEALCAEVADLGATPPEGRDRAGGGVITSRMHGALVALAVQPGQKVARGEFVLAIEAMKMEHRIEAPVAGTVVEVGASVGTQVAPGRLLLRIEPETAAATEPE
ncbi:MAG: ATP-grasp domain-containing protein [Burkholderiales bacterium]|nr:ATP-grasp domain-containing protein [Burkholderiales bacterium]